MFRKALEDVSRKEGVKVSDGSEQQRGSVYEDAGLNELAERYRRGDLSQAEYLEAYNEYLEQNPGLEEDFFEGRQFDLDENAESEVDQVLTNINYQGEVKLTKNSPSILLNQPGVKNLPMLMNASHIRENILTEEEAQKLGLKVNPNINYHGLGKTLFLDVIAGLDDVTEAYRGTKNAENSERRENYFILISKYTDKNGDVINVPVFINEKGLYNRIFIDTNKIATVFGRSELRRYLNNQIHNGNLVRIKKRSPQAGESTSPINADYGMKTPKNIISNSNGIVNTQNKKSDFDDANDFADDEMLYDSSFAAKYDPNNSERSKAIRKEREKRKAERKADEFSSRGLEGKDWWSKNRNKADRMFNKRELERLAKIKSELEDADELTVEQVTALWGEMRKLQRNVTAMSMAHQITNEELTQVTDLLRGDRTIEDIEKLPADRYNIDGIIAVAKAKLEYTITK